MLRAGLGTKHESEKKRENCLFPYLTHDNVKSSIVGGNLPQSCFVLMKTEGLDTVASAAKVKTKFDHASTLPRKASLADIERARVYFVAGAGLIKIGISTNIPSRFRAIRNSSPVPVELLGSFPGTTLFEGFLHDKFKHLRKHGEWFEDTPELREHIEWRLR